MNLRRRPQNDDQERGSIAPFLVVVVVMLLGVVGLVVDSSGKYQADQHAHEIASGAARAGANSITADTLIVGNLSINPQQARQTALNYIAAAGMQGNVTVTGQTVTVEVTTNYRTIFLSAFGVNELPGRGTAAAQLITQ